MNDSDLRKLIKSTDGRYKLDNAKAKLLLNRILIALRKLLKSNSNDVPKLKE